MANALQVIGDFSESHAAEDAGVLAFTIVAGNINEYASSLSGVIKAVFDVVVSSNRLKAALRAPERFSLDASFLQSLKSFSRYCASEDTSSPASVNIVALLLDRLVAPPQGTHLGDTIELQIEGVDLLMECLEPTMGVMRTRVASILSNKTHSPHKHPPAGLARGPNRVVCEDLFSWAQAWNALRMIYGAATSLLLTTNVVTAYDVARARSRAQPTVPRSKSPLATKLVAVLLDNVILSTLLGAERTATDTARTSTVEWEAVIVSTVDHANAAAACALARCLTIGPGTAARSVPDPLLHRAIQCLSARAAVVQAAIPTVPRAAWDETAVELVMEEQACLVHLRKLLESAPCAVGIAFPRSGPPSGLEAPIMAVSSATLQASVRGVPRRPPAIAAAAALAAIAAHAAGDGCVGAERAGLDGTAPLFWSEVLCAAVASAVDPMPGLEPLEMAHILPLPAVLHVFAEMARRTVEEIAASEVEARARMLRSLQERLPAYRQPGHVGYNRWATPYHARPWSVFGNRGVFQYGMFSRYLRSRGSEIQVTTAYDSARSVQPAVRAPVAPLRFQQPACAPAEILVRVCDENLRAVIPKPRPWDAARNLWQAYRHLSSGKLAEALRRTDPSGTSDIGTRLASAWLAFDTQMRKLFEEDANTPLGPPRGSPRGSWHLVRSAPALGRPRRAEPITPPQRQFWSGGDRRHAAKSARLDFAAAVAADCTWSPVAGALDATDASGSAVTANDVPATPASEVLPASPSLAPPFMTDLSDTEKGVCFLSPERSPSAYRTPPATPPAATRQGLESPEYLQLTALGCVSPESLGSPPGTWAAAAETADRDSGPANAKRGIKGRKNGGWR
ncbi:unnamed protein product [Pedinophyceae sp. YPF-701]|nr:unnamed protein product [Pedinophyceae sp. YPF-701]